MSAYVPPHRRRKPQPNSDPSAGREESSNHDFHRGGRGGRDGRNTNISQGGRQNRTPGRYGQDNRCRMHNGAHLWRDCPSNRNSYNYDPGYVHVEERERRPYTQDQHSSSNSNNNNRYNRGGRSMNSHRGGRGRHGARNNDHHSNSNYQQSSQYQSNNRQQQQQPEVRGMLGLDGDSPAWLNACRQFPNGVPRFDNPQDCQSWCTHYVATHGGSNPMQPHLQHIFTMLTDWKQVKEMLVPAIHKARSEPSSATKVEPNNDTTYGPSHDNNNTQPVLQALEARLNVPFHSHTNATSTWNTLRYLFFHMKCGIYVMIRNHQLRIFSPFVNSEYRNTWAHALRVQGDNLDDYYHEKRQYYRPENICHDKTQWWANGNIVCNEVQKDRNGAANQYWGDHFLAPLRDMLVEACRERHLPDCEFFLNKRDYPHLKHNQGRPVEPYGFLYDKDDRDPEQDVELEPHHLFDTYAPIVSFYAAAPDRFTDLPWPTSEDWEAACGKVFPSTFMHTRKRGQVQIQGRPRDLFAQDNLSQFERLWDDGRVATAFFRGTASGGGTTIDTNQRLKLAHLSHSWKNDPVKGGSEPYLDAALTGWNLRDKKIAESPMTFLRPPEFEFKAGREFFTPMYEQTKYKYLVYLDGHCAASRYGFLLRLGSVILKIESRQVADRLWYFPLLKPFVDHIPIRADLSDLEEKIQWCRQHDNECREIAENAKLFYETYVAREPLLDYVQMVCQKISQRYSPDDDQKTSVAIIVPYRDLHPSQQRASHLKQFVPHLLEILARWKNQGLLVEYHIYIMEQSDDGRKFNRGKLLNIGFQAASHSKDKAHDVFIFHDVDLLPEDDLAKWYCKHPTTPIHIARVWDRYSNNPKYFGGVVSFSSSDFQRINGFPNNFWGWGGEDDEMQRRLVKVGIDFAYPDSGTLVDLEGLSLQEKLGFLRENRDWKNAVKWETADEHKHTWDTNGLADLEYEHLETVFLDEAQHCSKITVDVKWNGRHWTNEKAGVNFQRED